MSKVDLGRKVLRQLYESRFVDEKTKLLAKQNKGGTFNLAATGHEMIGVACANALIPGKDWALPYYRDQAFALAFGVPLKELFAAFLAREMPHHSGGRMMPYHYSDKELRLPCRSSVVGAQFLQGVGCANGIRSRNLDEVVYVSAGNGATSQGDFHEALNFSSIHKLPVIFVIADNEWSISVTGAEQTASGSIFPIVEGYPGVDACYVDGCSYDITFDAMEKAVKRARKGNGPSVIVANVPRIAPHSGSDNHSNYKTEEQKKADLARDPIMLYEKDLLKNKILNQKEIDEITADVQKRINIAAKEAEKEPFPKAEDVAKNVFVEGGDIEAVEDTNFGKEVTIIEALNNAMHEEMARDEGVITFGEDVGGDKGGVFGVTKGLTDKFGVKRCFNTPLAESTIIALSIGMSIDGFHKPIAELQYSDYVWTGINQLFSELSSYHYRSNGEWKCPVVIRMTCGGYVQGGPYHSQSIEGFLAHCPGLKIAIPSNAHDAKGMLKMAIRDPNPVIFLEHKVLYRQKVFCARPEPSKEMLLPLGKASVVQEGSDLTIVTWGMTVPMSVKVSEELGDISVEIIDLRTIVPLDFETVLTSVKKTGKLLVVHESPRNCGVGAEISATITEKAFQYLDAPVQRLCALDTPISYSKILEDAVLPQTGDIKEAIQHLAQY